MKDFKELYEDAIETTFSGKLRGTIYNRELMNEAITVNDVEALRSLYQRYINLRNLGEAEFRAFETGTKPVTITHIIEHVDEPDMYECCACGADLKEFTKYCPHCGRLNIDFKEEN